MVKINCQECGIELEITKKAAIKQKFCSACSKERHKKRVREAYHKKKEAKRLCSCGCGRPVGSNLSMLSDHCYHTMEGDDEYSIGYF